MLMPLGTFSRSCARLNINEVTKSSKHKGRGKTSRVNAAEWQGGAMDRKKAQAGVKNINCLKPKRSESQQVDRSFT